MKEYAAGDFATHCYWNSNKSVVADVANTFIREEKKHTRKKQEQNHTTIKSAVRNKNGFLLLNANNSQ